MRPKAPQYGDVVRIGVAMSVVATGPRCGRGPDPRSGDAGLASDVTSVSSVSGGSITNGVVAHDLDLTSSTPSDVETSLARLMRQITGVGLFWFGAPTDGWLVGFLATAVLAVGGVLGLLVAYLFAGREVGRGGSSSSGCSAWWPAWPSRGSDGHGHAGQPAPADRPAAGPDRRARRGPDSRHDVGPRLVARGGRHRGDRPGPPRGVGVPAVFGGRGEVVRAGWLRRTSAAEAPPALLRDVDRPAVHHVFCATDLQSGGALYLTPRMVAGYRVGFGTPGDLPLAVAVQCSACRLVPSLRGRSTTRRTAPSISPASMTPIAGLPGPTDRATRRQRRRRLRQHGRPVGAGLPGAGRAQRLAARRGGRAELLIIVNAGKSAGWSPWKGGQMLSDLPGLARTIDILYDVSTSHRRKRFVSTAGRGRFRRGRGAARSCTSRRRPWPSWDASRTTGTTIRRPTPKWPGPRSSPWPTRRVGRVSLTPTAASRPPSGDCPWTARPGCCGLLVLTWISVWIVHGIGAPPDPPSCPVTGS